MIDIGTSTIGARLAVAITRRLSLTDLNIDNGTLITPKKNVKKVINAKSVKVRLRKQRLSQTFEGVPSTGCGGTTPLKSWFMVMLAIMLIMAN